MGSKRAQSHLSPSFFYVSYISILLDTQRKKKKIKREIKDILSDFSITNL